MINSSEFIKTYYSSKPDKVKSEIKSLYKTLIENPYAKIEDISKAKVEDLIAVITPDSSSIRYSRLLFKKTFLLNVINECKKEYKDINFSSIENEIKNFTVEDWLTTNCKRFYFSNLDEVLAFIKFISPLDSELPIQCICILIWYGFSYEDLIEFPKSKIDALDIDEKHKDILKKYASSGTVVLTRSGHEVPPNLSPYLFYSQKGNMATPSLFNNQFNGINKLAKDYGKLLTGKNLRYNSYFCSLYDSGIREQNFDKKTRTDYSHFEEYKMWLKIIKGE